MCQLLRAKTLGPLPFPASGDMTVPCLMMENIVAEKIQIRNQSVSTRAAVHTLHLSSFRNSSGHGEGWNGLQIRPITRKLNLSM